MLFNSWVFAGFLAIVLPLYYKLPFRAQNILPLAASYVFYGAWDWRFLGLLMLSTGMDFTIGLAMDNSRTEARRSAQSYLSGLRSAPTFAPFGTRIRTCSKRSDVCTTHYPRSRMRTCCFSGMKIRPS